MIPLVYDAKLVRYGLPGATGKPSHDSPQSIFKLGHAVYNFRESTYGSHNQASKPASKQAIGIMIMELRLTTFFFLLMSLQTCVNGTPIHRWFEDEPGKLAINWKTCKNKAITLNQLAWEFQMNMNETCNMAADVKDNMKIEARDLCDPLSISQTKVRFDLKKSV